MKKIIVRIIFYLSISPIVIPIIFIVLNIIASPFLPFLKESSWFWYMMAFFFAPQTYFPFLKQFSIIYHFPVIIIYIFAFVISGLLIILEKIRTKGFKKTLIPVGIAFAILTIGVLAFIRWENNYKSNIKVLNLSKPLNSKMVVFETERVIVNFGLNDFDEYLKKFIEKKEYYIKIDEKILSFIEEQAEKNNKIEINDATLELQKRIKDKHLADLLDTGKYTLFDKKKVVYLDKIKIETYSSTSRLSISYYNAGRKYILPDDNKIFFKTIDASRL